MANNDYITTDCKLTVSKNTAKLDEEIFLYKNDRNIKLLIEIVDNKYRYKSDDLSNLLVKYKASYAQVKWYKNAEVKKEFPIQATDDGKVVFVIEGQLIDEDTELGDYDLQLRLLNESQESIRSLPIIKGAVHILKPLFEEGDIATVNSAVADISMLSLDGDAIDTYNSDGTYNQTNWGNGDVISSAKLNKLEKVAKDNVDKVNKMPAKSIVEGGKIYLAKEDGTKIDSGTELPAGGTGTPYDDTQIKTDINTIKTDLGSDELTTTAKNVKGAVNEVAAQYKDIAKKTIIENNKLYLAKEDGSKIDIGTTLPINGLVIRDVLPNEIFEINNMVNIKVESVSINKHTTTIVKGGTETLTATVLPNNATNKLVTWTSDNTDIVTVNEGVITGVNDGKCNITVTTNDGNKKDTCSVIVSSTTISVESISLNKTTSELTVNDTEQLTVVFTPSNATNQNVVWSSSADSIATVVNGLVTAKAVGNVKITATSLDNNKIASCDYTVVAQASDYATRGLEFDFRAKDGSGSQTSIKDRTNKYTGILSNFKFDGTDGWIDGGLKVTVPSSGYTYNTLTFANVNLTTIGTFEIIFNPNNDTTNDKYFAFGGSNVYSYILAIENSKLRVQKKNSSGTLKEITETISLNNNSKNHVIVSLKANGIIEYLINGVFKSITLPDFAEYNTLTNKDIAVGRNERGISNATYYDIRFYNVNLTQKEMMQNYNIYTGGNK